MSHRSPDLRGFARGPLPWIVAALFLWGGAAGPGRAEERPAGRAGYEMAQRFSVENLKKKVFDLNVIPGWIGASDAFWYRWETSRGAAFLLVDCARGRVEPVFDPAALAASLGRALGTAVDGARLPIDTLAFSPDRARVQFAAFGALWELDRPSGRLRRLSEAESADERAPFNAAQMQAIRDYTGGGTLRGSKLISPDGRWAVYARDHNLFLVDEHDPEKTEARLTSDGEAWYGYDSSSEDDAGSRPGEIRPVFVTWLPDSSRFFLKRTDRRKVRDLYLLAPLSRPAPTIRRYKNALAGDEFSDQFELWVFDCRTRSGAKIKAERWTDQQIGGKAADGGVYPVPASDKIYFIRTDRTWTKTDLAEADLATGAVRTVLEEEGHPNVTPTSAQVRILDGGREIIWWSDREGWGHFYLYGGDGRLKSRITSGEYCSRSIVRVDEKARTLTFTASGREPGLSPYYEQLYRVGFDGKGLTRLTPEPAHHALETLAVSPSGRFFIDNPSRVDLAPRPVVRDAAGRKVLDLAPPDLGPLEAAGWKPPETFSVKAADGATDLYGVMWKPFDFDPARRYPVVLLTYPGPISEAIPQAFSPLFPLTADVAQLGLVVVMFGNRGGSSERSKAYGAFGYGNLRDFGLADKKAGLEGLAARFPFLDLDRVGVIGGSGGGFQATALFLTYPDLFKVGVSWAGNHDNSLMESYWSELNQGVREVRDGDKTRFEVKTPTNMELAANLKGHYLIMQGLQDGRVHPAIAYRMVQSLIEAGKPFDMVVVPDEQHQLTRARYLPYITRLIEHYFAFHLIGDPRSKAEIFEAYPGPVKAAPWPHR